MSWLAHTFGSGGFRVCGLFFGFRVSGVCRVEGRF